MEGLDIRILSITILLSLIFLSRALVDCMFAFNLINEQLNSFAMLLCIIILSEVCTSVAIVKLMKKGSGKSQEASDASLTGRSQEQTASMMHSQMLQTEKDSHFMRAANNG